MIYIINQDTFNNGRINLIIAVWTVTHTRMYGHIYYKKDSTALLKMLTSWFCIDDVMILHADFITLHM